MAFGVAAVWSHGLGDRKELSASHKQDSSCTHDTQDLEQTLPGKEKPVVWCLSMTHSRRTITKTLNKRRLHITFVTLWSLKSKLVISRGKSEVWKTKHLE